MRFLHGILVFNLLLASFLIVARPAYAAPWFTTYGGGVISGSADAQSIKTTQPYFDPVLSLFKSSLVQPGIINPLRIAPDNTYDFSYGGIIVRNNYDVKRIKPDLTTEATDDAFAKQMGIIGDSFPNYQRFIEVATPIEDVCNKNCNKLLIDCSIAPGVYKLEKPNCLQDALNSLNDITLYGSSINSSGLVVLIENDPGPSSDLKIQNNVKSGDNSKRLVIVTNKPIKIQFGVGTLAASPDGLISQVADIQAMLVTTSTSDPAVDVPAGSTKSLKIEGPLISKGKVSFKRDADIGVTKRPGVFVQFNPFYTAELAKLDALLNIFGSSTARWVYE